jgi:serine/threonine protein kinase
VPAIGETLGYAHERGVIHRDVKPASILLDSTGRPLLLTPQATLCRSCGASGLLNHELTFRAITHGERVSSRFGRFRRELVALSVEQLKIPRRNRPI